nr:MAG TPA: hypothetical protein [Caudoviricetes sp.]
MPRPPIPKLSIVNCQLSIALSPCSKLFRPRP